MPPAEKTRATTPEFLQVRSVSQFRKDGHFRRAGIRFDHSWKTLRVDNAAHSAAAKAGAGISDPETAEKAVKAATQTLLDNGIISGAIYSILDKESFLAVKPASAADIRDYEDARAHATSDPSSMAAQLVEQSRRIADLEAMVVKSHTAPGAKE